MKKEGIQLEEELKRIRKKFFSFLLKPFNFIINPLSKSTLRGRFAKTKATSEGALERQKESKENGFFWKVLDFVKYHNAFTIAIVLLFVFSATIFASEGVRDTIIGEKIETEEGIDNSVIISKNINSFNPEIIVNSVDQDENNYYVNYSFDTVGIKENSWQDIKKERILKVSKDALKKNDLGLYVQKELSQIVDNELTYLKEVQEAETEKGETEVLVATKYTGLIGLAFDVRSKVFSNYDPVVKKPKKQIAFTNQENNNSEIENNKGKDKGKDESKNNNSTSTETTNTNNLETTNLNGITLYDQSSKDPFCISMIEGAIMARPGECGSQSLEESASIENSTTSTETSSTSTISTNAVFSASINNDIQQISSLLNQLQILQESLKSTD